ncbi:MAG TPA: hypothetical protein VLV83_10385 [Acidobacteriota bacterium]|nr:hypothetical protein [Acidobacteriota bacterium]
MLKNLTITRIIGFSAGLRWFLMSVMALLVIAVIHSSLAEWSPGNWWGLSYGWAAALLMAGAGAYAWRRRIPAAASSRGLGSARSWLQFHIYGGLLCLLLIFLHMGFSLPTGQLTWLLFLLSLWTIVSGLLGVAIQKYYPRLLASGLSVEALYQRIPELTAELRERAEKLIEECGPAVGEFYGDRLEPVLEAPSPRWTYLLDIRGGIDTRLREFDHLSRVVGEQERAHIEELRRIYRAKLELDAQYSVQRLLRGWLVIHGPLSLALLALLLLHILSIGYY